MHTSLAAVLTFCTLVLSAPLAGAQVHLTLDANTSIRATALTQANADTIIDGLNANATHQISATLLPAPTTGSYQPATTFAAVSYAATLAPAIGATGATTLVSVAPLTGNLTVANPTGTPVDGQILKLRVSEDATGGRTLTFGSTYVFGTDITLATLPTTASANWEILFEYNAAASKWRAVGLARGF